MPVIDLMRRHGLCKSRILEVGSGGIGIAPYLKKQLTGLDVDFSDGSHALLNPVTFKGGRFPFADDSYELVICVDAYEHIPPGRRLLFIGELLRVASGHVILAVPSGSAAQKQDKRLLQLYKKIHGQNDRFLKEHLNYGLPQRRELSDDWHQAGHKVGKNCKIIKIKKLLNLKLHAIIMYLAIRLKFTRTLYHCLILFLPLRRFFNFGRCYRDLYFVEVKK
jgi:hypothetical protein